MDPFSQASLSPTDFHHRTHPPPGVGATALHGVNVQLPPQQAPGPRNYKSRKYRPCDFCRARQVACKIEVSPPCQLCQSHGRQCTFVEQPKKKRRPNNNPATTSQNVSPVSNTGTPDSGIIGQIGWSFFFLLLIQLLAYLSRVL
jgi:hypothetical protein